ncbi:MAG: metallophosphoesterase family protein [Gemmatimonadaceae bacterium]|nr:metallophosphoesterase family protein [Gemmatimonadaceae bacterium]MCW5826813.1 metallophosphoesterase family protein [Gemmatimonadaceae bacterium]
MADAIRIGLISDTHGLLRPQVHEVFAGVDRILHAGDVCSDTILTELGLIAPTQAVFGNCDDPWDPSLREALDVDVGGLRIHVQHGHELGRPKPARVAAAYDADVCVYGHTHQQVIERVDGRLIVNPGAAGPRRFDLRPCVAILTIADGVADATLVELEG